MPSEAPEGGVRIDEGRPLPERAAELPVEFRIGTQTELVRHAPVHTGEDLRGVSPNHDNYDVTSMV